MSRHSWSLRTLTDSDLLGRLKDLVGQERESIVDVIERLREADRRDLALDRGFTSTFAYCTQVLRYSESEAFLRIRAARASEKFPRLLDDLRDGRVHLDSIARLAPHLENIGGLIERAAGASKKEVLAIVAQLQPEQPPQRDVIVPVARVAPAAPAEVIAPAAAAASSSPSVSAAPHVIAPPPQRFHFTADHQLLELVEKLRGLLRHKYPDGRLEAIFKEAALALIERIDPGRPRSPREAAPRKRTTKGWGASFSDRTAVPGNEKKNPARSPARGLLFGQARIRTGRCARSPRSGPSRGGRPYGSQPQRPRQRLPQPWRPCQRFQSPSGRWSGRRSIRARAFKFVKSQFDDLPS